MRFPDSLPGATWLGEGQCRFRVWAPEHPRMEVHLLGPPERTVALEPGEWGYHEAVVDDLPPGALYRYRLPNGVERPDPASRSQPQGVHGPSAVVDPAFDWDDDDFRAPGLAELVLYELHVGTFTPEGTLDSAAGRLDDLRELGVNAVELMPLAQFPGERNWGYDGAYPWAVQASYGGPGALRRFVREAHRRGMAVHLDVVYNHLGPEGNYLGEFGPYFTNTYRTPWGPAVNFDGPDSDQVREYFVGNALHWIREHHIDGLRLDAIHAIVDSSARPFLEELTEAVEEEAGRSGRPALVVGETNQNDSRLVQPREEGGTGLDAIWTDDLHHSLHTLLTGESHGYYQDFRGVAELERALRDRFAYAGRYSPHRRRSYGRPARHLPADRFVVAAQNHDQVGNRVAGDRLSALVPRGALGLAASVLLLSPYVPLLFMGEEYGETAPFPYFTSHGDPELARAVREGRKREFSSFHWEVEPPDPQAEETFESARLRWQLREEEGHRGLLALYRELLRLRREHPALASRRAEDLDTQVDPGERLLVVRRWSGSEACALLFHFSGSSASHHVPLGGGRWRRVLDTGEERWGGGGTKIPPLVESDGPRTLELGAWSGVMLERV